MVFKGRGRRGKTRFPRAAEPRGKTPFPRAAEHAEERGIRRPNSFPDSLIPQVSTSFRPTAFGVLTPLVIVLFVAVGVAAAPQQPTDVPVVSLERIREALQRTPTLKLEVQSPPHIAVFKMSVEQRVFDPDVRGTASQRLRSDPDAAAISELGIGVLRARRRPGGKGHREGTATAAGTPGP